jgi:hypothetical protein
LSFRLGSHVNHNVGKWQNTFSNATVYTSRVT